MKKVERLTILRRLTHYPHLTLQGEYWFSFQLLLIDSVAYTQEYNIIDTVYLLKKKRYYY